MQQANFKGHRRAHLLGKSLVLARRKWEISHEEDAKLKKKLKGLVQNANKEKEEDEDNSFPPTYATLPPDILVASWLYTCEAEAKRSVTHELRSLGVKQPAEACPVPRPAFSRHLLPDVSKRARKRSREEKEEEEEEEEEKEEEEEYVEEEEEGGRRIVQIDVAASWNRHQLHSIQKKPRSSNPSGLPFSMPLVESLYGKTAAALCTL